MPQLFRRLVSRVTVQANAEDRRVYLWELLCEQTTDDTAQNVPHACAGHSRVTVHATSKQPGFGTGFAPLITAVNPLCRADLVCGNQRPDAFQYGSSFDTGGQPKYRPGAI